MRKMSHLLLLLICVSAWTPLGFARPAEQTPVELERPLRTTLRVEGRNTPLKGQITAWTYGTFWVLRNGREAPLRIEWSDLRPQKVFETARRLIDRKDSRGFLNLGIEMLRLEEAALADRAFKLAVALDSELGDVVERAEAIASGGGDPWDAIELPPPVQEDLQRSIPQRLGADPLQEDRQRAGQSAAMRQVNSRLERLLIDAEIHESEHFIAVVDRGDIRAKELAVFLERIHETALTILIGEKDGELFEGKWVCYLITERAWFSDLQVQMIPGSAERLMFHFSKDHGAFIEFGVRNLTTSFISWDRALLGEILDSMLQRFRTARQLPSWLHVGLRSAVWWRLAPSHEGASNQIRAAKEYCEYNSIAVFARWNVTSFDARHRQAQHVCRMFVEYLLSRDPDAFREWILAIKDGNDWEYSMEDYFELDLDAYCAQFEAQLGVK